MRIQFASLQIRRAYATLCKVNVSSRPILSLLKVSGGIFQKICGRLPRRMNGLAMTKKKIMKIFIGADHRGFKAKESIKSWLLSLGHDVTDCGNAVYDPDDDFPDFAFAVAEKVVQNSLARPPLASLGLVFCGSGGGVTVAANKVKNIRCVTALTVEDVKHNRVHNDANVLAIATDIFKEDEIKKMIETFLETKFSPEDRFVRRIRKITAYEEAKQ